MAPIPPIGRNTRGKSTAALAGAHYHPRSSTRTRSAPTRLSPAAPTPKERPPIKKTKKIIRTSSAPLRRPLPPPSSPRPTIEGLSPDTQPEPLNMSLDGLSLLEQMMQRAAQSVPETQVDSIEQFTATLLNNPCLFGDEATTNLFKNFSVNTKLHENRLEKLEERFFYVLSNHPDFRFLAESIVDPEIKNVRTMIRRFYVAVRGVKTDTKKKILNYSLILFSQSFIKVDYHDADLTDPFIFAQAQYEPNTVDMNLRCLFGIFKSRSVAYSKSDDFHQRGDFPAYWKHVFELVQKERPDYGTKPKAATFDPDFRNKRRQAIAAGIFQPLTNYTHHTWMLLEELMTVNMLRGAAEPSGLTVNDFIHGVMPSDSRFVGRRYYRIRSSHGQQKRNTITLANQTINNERNNHAYVPMVEPPDDQPDPLSLYNMLDHHLNEYMPTEFPSNDPSNGRIFRRRASQKQLDVHFIFFSRTLSLKTCCRPFSYMY